MFNLVRDDAWQDDLLVGFRELSLREELDYDTEASNLQPGGAASFQGISLAPRRPHQPALGAVYP